VSEVTVVRGGLVWTGSDAVPGDVVITDGVITSLTADAPAGVTHTIDATDSLVLPGLINSHVHPGGSPLLRGIAEDNPLPSPGALYHNTVDFRLISWQHLRPDEIESLVAWEAAAMLLGGATTIVSEQVGDIDQWISVARRLGFRTDVGRIYPYPPHIANGTEISGKSYDAVLEGMQTGADLVERFDGTLDGRLTLHLAPHAPNTVPTQILAESAELARKRNVRLHLHIAQHPSEVQTVRSRTGLSPVRYLDDIGFLGPNVLATHLTYTDAEDWDVLARTGTNVVHCGSRKAREAVTSPFVELLDRGVNVCLATETYSHDLVDELKWSALLAKLRAGRVDRPDAKEMIAAVTTAPASALGRGDLGVLRAGARGDVTVVGLDGPFNGPAFDAARNLVYYSRASNVRHTLVDGRPVVADGEVVGVDMAQLHQQARTACQRVWQIANDLGQVNWRG
jgi:5-methylthioadenosine/S-adenosylhomocysteine deaminase